MPYPQTADGDEVIMRGGARRKQPARKNPVSNAQPGSRRSTRIPNLRQKPAAPAAVQASRPAQQSKVKEKSKGKKVAMKKDDGDEDDNPPKKPKKKARAKPKPKPRGKKAAPKKGDENIKDEINVPKKVKASAKSGKGKGSKDEAAKGGKYEKQVERPRPTHSYGTRARRGTDLQNSSFDSIVSQASKAATKAKVASGDKKPDDDNGDDDDDKGAQGPKSNIPSPGSAKKRKSVEDGEQAGRDEGSPSKKSKAGNSPGKTHSYFL